MTKRGQWSVKTVGEPRPPEGANIATEVISQVVYPAQIADFIRQNAANPRPAAWCATDPSGEIQFLSKAKERADILAEGTGYTVEPLYRGEAPVKP